MPTYDYSCSKCEHVQEEFHYMSDRPDVRCKICGKKSVRLIGAGAGVIGMNAGRATYDFVDFNTTGRPVHIKSKRHWNEHLRRHGLNDDVPNAPIKNLKEGNQNFDKQKAKRELRKTLGEAIKDKAHINTIKQNLKVRKGGIKNGR